MKRPWWFSLDGKIVEERIVDLYYIFLLNVTVFFQIVYNEAQPSLNLHIREIKTFYFFFKEKTNTNLHAKKKKIIVATPDQVSGAKREL